MSAQVRKSRSPQPLLGADFLSSLPEPRSDALSVGKLQLGTAPALLDTESEMGGWGTTGSRGDHGSVHGLGLEGCPVEAASLG